MIPLEDIGLLTTTGRNGVRIILWHLTSWREWNLSRLVPVLPAERR